MNTFKKIIFALLFVQFLPMNCILAQQTESVKLPINQNVKEIIVICKTHFDIGYTHRVKDLIPYYQTTMIDKALDIIEKTNNFPLEQQFSWTAPGWVMSKVLEDWKGQTPYRRERLEKAFKSGRFVTHALPFTIESESLFPEAIARGYEFSDELCKKYGLPMSHGAKMTDVPSQGSILATVLAQGGVKFLHLGCNWPSQYVKYPTLFWWEGPDGSRVLTMYSNIYGTTVGLTYPDKWTDHFPIDQTLGRNLIPPSDWPYSVWPAIFVTPDNSGPPSPKDVHALLEEAHRLLPGVKIRMGQLEDFATAILATHPNIPVVKKEAPDTWIHGYGCDPGGMKVLRNIQPFLSAAEILNTQLLNNGVAVSGSSKDISKAYEQCLLYAEHTWGGAKNINQYGNDFKHLSPENYKDLEDSWEDKTNYIRMADSIVKSQLKTNLKALAENVNQKGKRVVVYNSLPWMRSEWVKLPQSDISFFAKEIPACGYRTFSLDEIKKTKASGQTYISTNNTIENAFYRITFDAERGRISSLIELKTGKEWADNESEQGLGQYMNERFTFEQTLNYTLQYQQGRAVGAFGSKGDWPHPGMHKPGMISEQQIPYRSASSKNAKVIITRNAQAQIMQIEFPADTANHFPASSLAISLQNNMPFVDMELTLKNKTKDNWPEADWFCFPFKIKQPDFRVGRTLGVMNPARDIMDGANRHLYAVGAGVSIKDADGSGVTVCPLDHPLVSLGSPGIWKFSHNFIPQTPVIYLNLYNNQWNTNFRYWYAGTWSSRVRIWTFDNKSTEAEELQIPSIEALTPLLISEANGKGGTLPLSYTGIELSRKGIEISAFKQEGRDILMRLWERAGIAGSCTVKLADGMKISTVQPVNLRGEIIGDPIKVTENSFSIYLRDYAPASFILNL